MPTASCENLFLSIYCTLLIITSRALPSSRVDQTPLFGIRSVKSLNQNSSTTLKCPPMPKGIDCMCHPHDETDEIEISCMNLRSENDLLEVLRTFPVDLQKKTISLLLQNGKYDQIGGLVSETSKLPFKPRIRAIIAYYNDYNFLSDDLFEQISDSLESITLFDNIFNPKMDAPKIKMFLGALSHCHNLKRLYLSLPELFDLDVNYFDHFDKLDSLTLITPNLRFVIGESKFKSLRDLTSLTMVSKLPYIPESLVALPKLRGLTFRSNVFKTLPEDAFENVSRTLVKLDLGDSQLDTIPAHTLDPILNIQILDLSDNRLKRLPQLCMKPGAHSNENNVTHIDLSMNHLTTHSLYDTEVIDKWSATNSIFAGCDKLEHLWLEDNNIGQMPADVLTDAAHSLVSLNLAKNSLQEIPVRLLGTLPKLEKLTLSGNQITKVPVFGFVNNTHLTEVDLTANKIEGMFSMESFQESNHSLNTLRLAYNNISKFHFSQLENFDNLTDLDLSHNNLTSLKGIVDLTLLNHHLFNINLRGNPLVCDCDVAALIKWYYYESKLIAFPENLILSTCSNPGLNIGKSSIINRSLLRLLKPECKHLFGNEEVSEENEPKEESDTTEVTTEKEVKTGVAQEIDEENENEDDLERFAKQHNAIASSVRHAGHKGAPLNNEQKKRRRTYATLVSAIVVLIAIASALLAALMVTGCGFSKRIGMRSNLFSKFHLGNQGKRSAWNTGTSDRLRIVNQELPPMTPALSTQDLANAPTSLSSST